MKADYIQIKDLSFSYPNAKNGETKVLNDISFNVKEGEFVAIVGPSGCGKTTLLNLLDGLLTTKSGALFINKKLITKPDTDRAFVFQESLLLPWRNVLENIGFGAEMQGVDKLEISKRVEKLVRLTHLSEFEKFYPHQLSGGMKQRVNLSRALCVNPKILLLDEPFSSLDAQTREILQQELLDIYRKTKKTSIFVTHQIEEAVFLADKIIVLSKRPATVKKIISVNLKRPRLVSIKDSNKFISIKNQIAKTIKNEIYV